MQGSRERALCCPAHKAQGHKCFFTASPKPQDSLWLLSLRVALGPRASPAPHTEGIDVEGYILCRWLGGSCSESCRSSSWWPSQRL